MAVLTENMETIWLLAGAWFGCLVLVLIWDTLGGFD